MLHDIDITEALTVIGLVLITLYAIYTGSDSLASATGGGLIGYLTKTLRIKTKAS